MCCISIGGAIVYDRISQGPMRRSCHFSGWVIIVHWVHGVYFQQMNCNSKHLMTPHVLRCTIPTYWQESPRMKLAQFLQAMTYSFSTDIDYQWMALKIFEPAVFNCFCSSGYVGKWIVCVVVNYIYSTEYSVTVPWGPSSNEYLTWSDSLCPLLNC